MPDLFKWIEKIKPHIPPQGLPASDRDEVWLFDNTAFRSSPSEPWKAEYVAAFFHHNKESREKIADAVAAMMHEMGFADKDTSTRARIEERLAPFLRSIASNMNVDVLYEPHSGGDSVGPLHLGPSDGNGISSQLFNLETAHLQPEQGPTTEHNPLTLKVSTKEVESAAQHSLTCGLESGCTYLAEDGGWALISDIDDTVKISCVNNRKQLLENTFVNQPQHTDGMPELYQAIHSAISTNTHPAPFFYISASPYNLYPFLRKFIKDSEYPDGMIILRDMSWLDIHNWYNRHDDSFLHTIPVKKYKDDRFRKVASWLPKTTWVCCGDSTQSDPEAYAEFYHQLVQMNQGGRIARIFIRKVVGVNPKMEATLNTPERFEKAFEGIPKSVWKVFTDGKELMEEVEKLKVERNAVSSRPVLQGNYYLELLYGALVVWINIMYSEMLIYNPNEEER
ncbi:hypothetical protein CPB86DRAFT_807906 [Serendipita vermifera]|nr:hypothetical protein CPB86DRAFT_807906 [Serendipita vermifera]